MYLLTKQHAICHIIMICYWFLRSLFICNCIVRISYACLLSLLFSYYCTYYSSILKLINGILISVTEVAVALHCCTSFIHNNTTPLQKQKQSKKYDINVQVFFIILTCTYHKNHFYCLHFKINLKNVKKGHAGLLVVASFCLSVSSSFSIFWLFSLVSQFEWHPTVTTYDEVKNGCITITVAKGKQVKDFLNSSEETRKIWYSGILQLCSRKKCA